MKFESLGTAKFEKSALSKEMMQKVTGGEYQNSIWGTTGQTDKISFECTGNSYDKIIIAPDGQKTTYEKPKPWK